MSNLAHCPARSDTAFDVAAAFDQIDDSLDAPAHEAASEAAFECFMLGPSAGFGSELREWLPTAWAQLASACQRPRRSGWLLATRVSASRRQA